MSLDEIYQEALDSPDIFSHKRVLWIGSESYVAPAICVLQGLDKLGFEIHVIGKPNVNSWFCNQVVEDPRKYQYDFILSSLHWGTRWSHYDKFQLYDYPKVLIDGDDAVEGRNTWRTRYDFWVERYGYEENEAVKDTEIMTHRWMEPLDDYEPDVLFVMQKQHGEEAFYIPSGIHRQYMAQGQPYRGTKERHIDFVHIPGPGVWREAMKDLIDLGVLYGTVHDIAARGQPIYPPEIEALAGQNGANVHSYHRWACWTTFYHILNHSKILIHPGIDYHSFWDCKRPYEGMACGCLVLMSIPCTDVSDYPVTQVCPETVYNDHTQFIHVANALFHDPGYMEAMRWKCTQRGYQFFTPEPVARYFLHKVAGC